MCIRELIVFKFVGRLFDGRDVVATGLCQKRRSFRCRFSGIQLDDLAQTVDGVQSLSV